MSKLIEIFTDGGSRGNPGPGGWAAILRYGDHVKEIFGAEENTTNNRMELTAAIEALTLIKKTSEIIFVTDSEYLQKGVMEWMNKWKQNGWVTADKKPVKNKDLWEKLDKVLSNHKIKWEWVKGHSGHRENERVDELVNLAIDKLQGK